MDTEFAGDARRNTVAHGRAPHWRKSAIYSPSSCQAPANGEAWGFSAGTGLVAHGAQALCRPSRESLRNKARSSAAFSLCPCHHCGRRLHPGRNRTPAASPARRSFIHAGSSVARLSSGLAVFGVTWDRNHFATIHAKNHRRRGQRSRRSQSSGGTPSRSAWLRASIPAHAE